MASDSTSHDITRSTLAVLFIVALIGASFLILRPFLGAVVWASMIVIAIWPIMLRVQAYLWGSRRLAVLTMTVLLLLVLFIPLTLAIASIVSRSDDILGWARSLVAVGIPEPPNWLRRIPLAGPKIAAQWEQMLELGPGVLSEHLAPYFRSIVKWSIAELGSLGIMIVQCVLTVIISAVLFAYGEQAALGVCRFARRLAGRHGEDAAILAAKAVRSVAAGVIVTALIQAVLAGIGLGVSGIPGAAVLTAIVLILCVAQLGPGLVLIPVVIWLFWSGQPLWGSIMAVWTIIVGTLDNFVRPVLIKKGANLPLLLIFAGVIGGLIAFGIIGLFIGPVLLAVTYTLLVEWVSAHDVPSAPPAVDGSEQAWAHGLPGEPSPRRGKAGK